MEKKQTEEYRLMQHHVRRASELISYALDVDPDASADIETAIWNIIAAAVAAAKESHDEKWNTKEASGGES